MKFPVIKVTPPGPKARAIVERDHRYIATTTKTNPIVAKSARGSLVEDVDGNTIVDFASGIGVVNMGHCHPRVVEAVQRQAAELMHFAGTDFYYEVQARLAEELGRTAPGAYSKKVFFTNSGTESIEAGLKIARFHREGKQFVGFLNAFHGRTMGSLAFTSSKPKQHARFFPWMSGVHHVLYPDVYHRPDGYTADEWGLTCAREIEERIFEHMAPPEEFAGILFEPIQGEGGYIVPPKSWMKEVERIAKRNGLFLIDDEVQTGVGRTGKMWAVENFDVTPDIICSAKGLGNGLPIGAAIFPAKHDFSYEGAHSNTYGGNPVACAAALAVLETIKVERVLENATKMGDRLHKRLKQFEADYEIVGEARGIGLMQATEFVTDKESKTPNPEARDAVTNEAMRRGLALLPCGKSVLRYIPPLTIEQEILDAGVDVLEESIAAVSQGKAAKTTKKPKTSS